MFSVPRQLQENEGSLGASDMKLIKMEDPLEVIEDLPQPQDIEMTKCMDTERIIMGQKLTDEDISDAQKILGAQFAKLNGDTVPRQTIVGASQRQLDLSNPLPSKRPLDPCNNCWM